MEHCVPVAVLDQCGRALSECEWNRQPAYQYVTLRAEVLPIAKQLSLGLIKEPPPEMQYEQFGAGSKPFPVKNGSTRCRSGHANG